MKFNTDSFSRYMTPLHPDGWMFVAIFAIASLILGSLSGMLLYFGLLATAWCAYFFRDPERVVPSGEGLIISAADGIVESVATVSPPPELGIGEEDHIRISTLLSLMDVHVNRVPVSGTVTALKYHKGAFLNATLEKAHEDNERQYIGIKTTSGATVGVVQIAGMISRRIVCKLKEEQAVNVGERFGIIRFGSRVDVYIPTTATPLVVVGQRMVGGETVLANLASDTTS